MKKIPTNTDEEGNAKTILAGYFKYGVATLLGGGYGTTGTIVIEYEEESSGSQSDEGRQL